MLYSIIMGQPEACHHTIVKHYTHTLCNITCISVVCVLETDDYKAHYYYNTITHSETNLYGTIIISLN